MELWNTEDTKRLYPQPCLHRTPKACIHFCQHIRRIQRGRGWEKGEEIFAVQNNPANKHISIFFPFTQNTSHQRTENRTDNGQGEKTAPEIASPQHIQNREKTDARREKRQTVTFKSHQRIILLEAMLFIFRQFLKPTNECTSDINRWLSTFVGFWLNIHKMATYWVPPGLGQFVWAAGEQSIFYL